MQEPTEREVNISTVIIITANFLGLFMTAYITSVYNNAAIALLIAIILQSLFVIACPIVLGFIEALTLDEKQ